MVGALVLQSVTANDSGTYWCTAVNSLTGKEVETRQKITVSVESAAKGPPAMLYEAPRNVTVRPGTTAILECPGVGYPVPKAIWNRSDASIANNRTSILGYGLQIVNARPDDRGEYTCRLENGVEPAKEYRIQLNLYEAPTFVKVPDRTLIDEDERLELECIAKGFPAPATYWLINGMDVRQDASIRVDGNTLVVGSLQKRHAGIVQCFARNDEGEVSESILLQVKPKQISGEMINPSGYVGTIPHMPKSSRERGGKVNKGRKKHKREYSFLRRECLSSKRMSVCIYNIFPYRLIAQ